MSHKWIKAVFFASAVYDGVLGLGFLFCAHCIFGYFGVTLPNHMAYVQFPALLLIIFAIMFFQISRDPVRYRDYMLYGMGLKVAYIGIVLGYHWTSGIPSMWLPWAYIDIVFLIAFILAWTSTRTVHK